MSAFRDAMTDHRYRVALQHCRAGLALTVPALKVLTRSISSVPSIPFVQGPGAAVAALFDDDECFRLMDKVAAYINPLVGPRQYLDVNAYRRDAKLVVEMRAQLEQTPRIALNDLKSQIGRHPSSRMLPLLKWMEKNLELVLEKDGKNVTVAAGAPAFKGAVVFPTFREGRNLASPLARPSPSIPRPDYSYERRPHDDAIRREARAIPLVEPHREWPLPPELRQSGVMNTTIMKSGCWLIGYSKRKSDLSYTTAVVVKSQDGESLKSFSLDHKVVRAFSSNARNRIVILDSILGVHVYDFDGTLVAGFSLLQNPEFQSVFLRTKESQRPTEILRCVDVHPTTGDILFSVLDRFWRFTSGGELLCALVLPKGPPIEAPRRSARPAGSEITLPSKGQLGAGLDWIYFARFSDLDDSVLLSKYSGLFLRISQDGEFLQQWALPDTAALVVEEQTQLIVQGWRRLGFLSEDGKFETHDLDGGLLYPAYGVGRHMRDVAIFDMKTKTKRTFRMSRDVKAVYPAKDKVRVDMATAFAELEIQGRCKDLS